MQWFQGSGRRKYREARVVRIDIWCHERGENVEKHKFKILVIRDMFLTPNANAYERSMLLTPNINVYERRLLHRATQYVKVCGYVKRRKVDRWLVRRLRRGNGW